MNKLMYKIWLRKLFRYIRIGGRKHPETFIASTLTAHYFQEGKTPLEVYDYLLRLNYVLDPPLTPEGKTRAALTIAVIEAYGMMPRDLAM